ncbi:Ku protein [Aromatoleum anaerobium]|uniref:Non-homologous end joining protein Ku n=1 Tax=Aromatoleum anaerobium TaxID=182180 RepID=A0ABX1PM87_9RHOO|nr:Ku protein [Aromatoleum anaerobium]MCK0508241.1 Ku protein [Aromatoleum anaerobium]
MPRVVWKGAIAFGLVHVPVALYPASTANRLDLDLLDRRDFAPVGYQRINKRTGEPVSPSDIVKGYQYEDGQYVVVTDEDFREANVEATQTVEIVAFVSQDDIPPYYFDTPYYLEPGRRGEKGYALLRETLRRTARVGLALVVIRSRQHLAAVIPVGAVLLMNTLRFADEIRSMDELKLPGEDIKTLGVSARELDMAERLVEGMVEDWAPEQYRDTYRDDLMARIEARIESGRTHVLAETPAKEPAEAGAEVVDLMALLKRSLEGRSPKRTGGKARSENEEEGAVADEDSAPPPSRTAARKSAASGASVTKPPAAGRSARARTTASRNPAGEPGKDGGGRSGAETRRRRA